MMYLEAQTGQICFEKSFKKSPPGDFFYLLRSRNIVPIQSCNASVASQMEHIHFCAKSLFKNCRQFFAKLRYDGDVK